MKKLAIGAAVVLVAGLVAATAGAGDYTYVGAKKCKMCHKVEFTSWQNTVHAKATEVAKKGAEGRTWGPECAKCHATNADPENFPGVQCEMCHGPGSAYKKMSIMKDVKKAVANGLVIPSQETCNRCHDGKDHHKQVKFEEAVKNKNAIHEFKHDPAKYREALGK